MEQNPFLKKLLDYYSLSEEEYEDEYLSSSFSLPSISKDDKNLIKTLKRLDEAKAKKEKVLIYGDYDCDGIMATSIMRIALKRFGIECDSYIPSRYIDGYALTKNNVEKIAKAGFKVILCVDNGVTAYDAIDFALSLGIDVLIIDHHEFGDKEIKSLAYLHPNSINYGEIPVSAGYLSYIFSEVLLGYSDDYLLCLGAISTISDMMPVKKYNRRIIKKAVELINQNKYAPIVSLTEKSYIDERIISFEIVPKINAIGRIDKTTHINRLPKYFSILDKYKISSYVEWINEINVLRKRIAEDASKNANIDLNQEAIVALLDIPTGLNGLVANRLLSQYEKPVAIFSKSENDPSILVGSIRSKEGFNVLEALKGNGVELVAGGGHEFAGGATIKAEDYPKFQKDFIYAALKHKLSPKPKKLITIAISECTLDNYNLIKTFGPFGHDHEEPKFLLTGLNSEDLTYTRNGKYLMTRLNTGAKLISFSINEDTYALEGPVLFDVRFAYEEYKGKFELNIVASRHI
ncbi:MAG: DHH family phosphoesterase [Bacilli bacterium]|nr:DHH family phosphoesterase [Bacilli bacterium]